MKSLHNNKGVALVILVIAITLIALLGTSLIVLMSDKWQGAASLINGYRASCLAEGGAEYAMKHISDGLRDTSKAYFINLQNTRSIGNQNLFGGTFRIDYFSDPNGDGNLADDYIESVSRYYGCQGKIRIKSFRRFLHPITFYPDYTYRPFRDPVDSSRIVMPVIGNHERNLTVSSIAITLPADMYLKTIYAPNSSSLVFNYSSSEAKTAYTRDCQVDPTVPCLHASYGLKLAANIEEVIKGTLSSPTVYRDDPITYFYFEFNGPAPVSPSQYIVKLTSNDNIPSGPWTTDLRFRP